MHPPASRQRRPLGESTLHNRRPSKQLPRSSQMSPVKPTPERRPPAPTAAAEGPASLSSVTAAPAAPALRPVKSTPSLRPASPFIPPSPSFPPSSSTSQADLAPVDPETLAPPQVVFHKDIFIHRHGKEFPHLHSRSNSLASTSLTPFVPVVTKSHHDEERTVGSISRMGSQGPTPTPLLSPPSSPPVNTMTAAPLPLPLALPLRPLEQWSPTLGSNVLSRPIAMPSPTAVSAGYPVASFSSNTDSDETSRVSGGGSAESHESSKGPDDSRSSTDMSSEVDLDFAFDRPGFTALEYEERAREVPWATPTVVGQKERQNSLVVQHERLADIRGQLTAGALVDQHRRLSHQASMSTIGPPSTASPSTSPSTIYGFQTSPNPSSLYTTPEHPQEPTFPSASKHPLPSPRRIQTLAKGLPEHRRGSSITYRFSPPTQPLGLPGFEESLEGGRRVGGWTAEEKGKGRAFGQRPLSPGIVPRSPVITPPPTAVTFQRPTSSTPTDATSTWPSSSLPGPPVRSSRAPLPKGFQVLQLAPPPKNRRLSANPPVETISSPAFAPILLPSSSLAEAERMVEQRERERQAKVSIFVQPSTPLGSPRPLSPVPSMHQPPRSRTFSSTTSSAFTSSYSMAYVNEHQPRSTHLRSRSSISRKRARTKQDEGLRVQMASAARGSLYERVEKVVRSPLAMLDGVLPAQFAFWAGFVLGPWCFVLGGWGMAPDGSFVLTRLQGARTNGRSYNRNRRVNWASTARQTSFDSVRSSFWPFSSAVAAPAQESRYEPERSGRYEYDSRQRADRRKRWVLPSLRNDHPSKWVFRNRVAAILSGLIVLPCLVLSVIFAIL